MVPCSLPLLTQLRNSSLLCKAGSHPSSPCRAVLPEKAQPVSSICCRDRNSWGGALLPLPGQETLLKGPRHVGQLLSIPVQTSYPWDMRLQGCICSGAVCWCLGSVAGWCTLAAGAQGAQHSPAEGPAGQQVPPSVRQPSCLPPVLCLFYYVGVLQTAIKTETSSIVSVLAAHIP